MEQVRILIVDDNPANLLALEAVLGQSPYTLVRATSGLEALRLVAAQEFAAVILDIRMPGLDGYETARRMKEIPGAEDIPIIFMTATYKAAEEIRRGYAVGAVDYFGKPFDPDVLKRKLKIYTDLYVKARQAREREVLQEIVGTLRWKGQALDAILGMVEEGVTVVGRQGTILSMNEAALRTWSGRAPARGADSWDYRQWLTEQGGGIESGAQDLHQALEGGAPLEDVAAEIRRFDDTHTTILNSISPLRDETGTHIGSVWLTREVASDGPRPVE